VVFFHSRGPTFSRGSSDVRPKMRVRLSQLFLIHFLTIFQAFFTLIGNSNSNSCQVLAGFWLAFFDASCRVKTHAVIKGGLIIYLSLYYCIIKTNNFTFFSLKGWNMIAQGNALGT
jgi:hypothetical protein